MSPGISLSDEPELARFYEAARTGAAEFLNGVRSVYPMEQGAMRFANMMGNKLFSVTLGFILGQPVKDTLCGTKVLFRRDYEAMARNRAFLGTIDPFGDFELLFGAARLTVRIVDLPVHYQARSYGRTNISRWRHGWRLLKMAWFAACQLRFVPLRAPSQTPTIYLPYSSSIRATKRIPTWCSLGDSLSQRGSGLKSIADLVGHQCLETTTGYTRVDLPRLTPKPRLLAQIILQAGAKSVAPTSAICRPRATNVQVCQPQQLNGALTRQTRHRKRRTQISSTGAVALVM